ncbi:MAG: 50S ribosomal protein L25, partial [Betaproteobacteria bacterium]|nr:50S ribosomal protein L25 [Betaproteobacteria bacterium]
GGVVQHIVNEIEIQCLPDDLPGYIEVDVKDIQLGYSLHVSELTLPKGVELLPKLKHDDPPIVAVQVPKEMVIEEEEVAAPVTEIIGEVPAEGEVAEAAEGEAGEKGEKKEPAKKEPAKKEPAKKD